MKPYSSYASSESTSMAPSSGISSLAISANASIHMASALNSVGGMDHLLPAVLH